jgi:co-chaperonin GroES (HSP10)
MLSPRNTLVILRLTTKAEEKIGGITISEGDSLYTEGEVMAVGPGTVQATGGISETFDLKVGQRVLVQHKQETPRGKREVAIRYVHNGEIFYLFEQTAILGVIAQPGEASPVEKKTEGGKSTSLILH